MRFGDGKQAWRWALRRGYSDNRGSPRDSGDPLKRGMTTVARVLLVEGGFEAVKKEKRQ